jgi:hypothetical protein
MHLTTPPTAFNEQIGNFQGAQVARSVKTVLARMAMAAVLFGLTTGLASPEKVMARLDTGLREVATYHSPNRQLLVTVWDGDKYVQCRRSEPKVLRCEAAGVRLQPSLAHVLTPDRVEHLTQRGWRIDPSFGNYARTFPVDAMSEAVMSEVLLALQFGYGADISAMEVKTDLVPRESCPRRNGYTQNLAGMINYAPTMRAGSIQACAYTPPPGPPPAQLAPKSAAAPVQHVLHLYGERLAGDVRWMSLAKGAKHVRRLILDTGEGYVQCESNATPGELYCEAASADSLPDLAGRLTPDRVAYLHRIGFADPGYAPNYSKTYRAKTIDARTISVELLTLLHDVYAYDGSAALEMKTDTVD